MVKIFNGQGQYRVKNSRPMVKVFICIFPIDALVVSIILLFLFLSWMHLFGELR